MRILKWLLIASVALCPAIAFAQSSPGLKRGDQPTAAQWNSFFSAKQDFIPGGLTNIPLTNGNIFFGVGGVATATQPSAFLDAVFGSTRGTSTLYRGASSWAALAPGTAGFPLVTGGAGADPSFARLSVGGGGTGVGTFTANLPILGNGTSGLVQGTRSGNTTTFATATGTLTNGHCVSIDASGNFIDAGGACTTGGGGGTVNAGTAGQIAYYATSTNAVSGATASGDCTFTAGAFVCTKTNGVSFAASATTDTTSASNISAGTLGCGRLPALTGDITTSAGSCATSLATSGVSAGSYGSGTAIPVITFDAKGRATLASTTGLSYATNTDIWSATANKTVDAAGINSAAQYVSLTDAATIAVDMTTGIDFTVTLGGNRTLGAPTNTQGGRSGCITVVQPASGGPWTLSYNAVWKFPGAVAPVLSTAANAVDLLCYTIKDSTHLLATFNADVR